MLSEQKIKRQLNTELLGRRVVLLPVVESTNSYAKELAAAGEPEGTLVVAEHQTAGRGRWGRSFFSTEGTGIYLSLVLRPELAPQKAVLLTSMTAVAAARAIDAVSGLHSGIKWVNDIFLNGKKVCGILVDAGINPADGRLSYAIVGIGINVGQMEFPKELQKVATTVSNECGREISREELIAAVVNEMERLYPTCATGDFLKESRERSVLLGREIRILDPVHGEEAAKAVEIDGQGQLVVEIGGKRRILNSGEVSIRF